MLLILALERINLLSNLNVRTLSIIYRRFDTVF